MSTGAVRRLGQLLAPGSPPVTVELVSCEIVTVNGDGTLDLYMGADKVTVIPSVCKIDLGAAVTYIAGDIVWGLYTNAALLIIGRLDT